MRGLLRSLSLSYFRHHPGRTVLAVLGIAVGVATFVSVRAAQQALADGFRTTVDRLAGRADLQITGVGGVPEDLADRLRDLPMVAATQPVIEQVVEPADAGLGSLLVLGVDLVGDTAMRDYGFDGEDTDVDDPLEFLAQPDSIALNRDFARRAGVAKGDGLTIRIGERTRRVTVRALLAPVGFARAYGGNIAITDVYAAQDLFGRGRHFDRIDIRVSTGTPLDAAVADLVRVVGPGYDLTTPERRGRAVEAMARAFVGAFDATSVLALAIGVFLIFNVFAVAIERRRADIGVLRAIGTSARQVATLFLCEAAVIGLVGGALGVLAGGIVAGRPYELMGTALEALQGVPHAGAPAITWRLAAQGLAIGVVASLIGAWVPAWRAARVPPIEAMARGVYRSRPARTSPRLLMAGGVLLAGAYLVGRYGLVSGRLLLPIVTVAGTLGTVVLAGRAALALLVPVTPALEWLAPAVGRIAAQGLRGQPRRTAATAAVLTISATFVLGVAGYLQAVRASLDRWLADVVTADVIVRAGPGLGPSSAHLPAALRAALLEVPGVAAADGFRQERIEIGARTATLVAIDARGFAARTRQDFVAGDERAFTQALPDDHQCVISDNLARRLALHVGDILTLTSPSGEVHLPVAAIVVDFISDRGSVMIDRAVFASAWADDRVDAFHVSLAPGANADTVRTALRMRLGFQGPLLVSTRREFLDELDRALASLYSVIRATVVIALVVAFMGIASALLLSVAERTRDIAVLRALGVTQWQVGVAIVLEAVTLACLCLAIAAPLGELLAWFLRARVSENFAGFRFPRAYPREAAWALAVGLPFIGAAASWLPARWAAALNVAGAVSYE